MLDLDIKDELLRKMASSAYFDSTIYPVLYLIVRWGTDAHFGVVAWASFSLSVLLGIHRIAVARAIVRQKNPSVGSLEL